MKPKTILQIEVVSLSSLLPKITPRQKQWAFDNCFEKNVILSRKTWYCLECGHSWKGNSELVVKVAGCKCPACGEELKFEQNYNGGLYNSRYYAIVTTKENMQVVRMFVAIKFCKKHNRPSYSCHEVMQHWITEEGKLTTLLISCNSMSGCYDAWCYGSALEVRTETYTHELRIALCPDKVYPEFNVLPIFKRNGIKKSFHGIAPHKLMISILKSDKSETLLKAGQYSLLRSHVNHDRIGRYNWEWKSVKICIRNKYKVKDAPLWFDYLNLLQYFKKDLFNSFYICPENLKKAHDTLMKKKQAIDEKRRKEREEREKELRLKRIEDNQKEFELEKAKFFGIQFKDSEISVNVLKNLEEFKIEGEALNHCVFTNEYYNRSKSLILSAKIDNQPVETIELSLENLSIVQARGKNNQPSPYHDKIINIVKRNLHQIAKII